MHYFVIEATPLAEGPDELEGAYVGCWVNFPLQDGAELLARHYIQKAGWTPGALREHSWVEKDDYQDDLLNQQYFAEAEEDGACFVFHSYPPGTEDAE